MNVLCLWVIISEWITIFRGCVFCIYDHNSYYFAASDVVTTGLYTTFVTYRRLRLLFIVNWPSILQSAFILFLQIEDANTDLNLKGNRCAAGHVDSPNLVCTVIYYNLVEPTVFQVATVWIPIATRQSVL